MADYQRRALNADEKRVLQHVLKGWERGAPYLQQLPTLQVTGRCGCGCVTVYFQAPGADEEEPALPLPIEAALVSEGGDPIGGLLIFEADGRLTALEAYSVGEDPVSTWPPNEQIRFEPPPFSFADRRESP